MCLMCETKPIPATKRSQWRLGDWQRLYGPATILRNEANRRDETKPMGLWVFCGECWVSAVRAKRSQASASGLRRFAPEPSEMGPYRASRTGRFEPEPDRSFVRAGPYLPEAVPLEDLDGAFQLGECIREDTRDGWVLERPVHQLARGLRCHSPCADTPRRRNSPGQPGPPGRADRRSRMSRSAPDRTPRPRTRSASRPRRDRPRSGPRSNGRASSS